MTSFLIVFSVVYIYLLISVFFDQGRLTRKNTTYHLGTSRSEIALTFDDGPNPKWTPQLLALLKQHKVHATFFLVGKNVKKYPWIVREIAESGHTIGNHTYNHTSLWKISNKTMEKEFLDSEMALNEVVGYKPNLFRPPKGLLWSSQKDWIRKRGYRIVLWSINSKDWVGFSSKRLIKRLRSQSKKGDILLFHDGGGIFSSSNGDRSNTILALNQLIIDFKKKGIKLVSL